MISSNSASFSGQGGGVHISRLRNCTLIGNSASRGGGVKESTVTHCRLIDNSASEGGGAHESTLDNCTLAGNSASSNGGGVFKSTVNSCTITGNSARRGGGSYDGTLNNCIIYYNNAEAFANYAVSLLKNCCTTPLPSPLSASTDNLTNPPTFIDTNAWSNLRLQADSPCINVGNSALAPYAFDLDGVPRISGGTVDIGAYEFQFPGPTVGLEIHRSGDNVTLTWTEGVLLEANAARGPYSTNSASSPLTTPSNEMSKFYRVLIK